MAKFSNAKQGDLVYDIRYGWGIILIVDDLKMTLIVDYSEAGGGISKYDFEGVPIGKSNNPMLFWNEVILPNKEDDIKPEKYIKMKTKNNKLFAILDKLICSKTQCKNNYKCKDCIYYSYQEYDGWIPSTDCTLYRVNINKDDSICLGFIPKKMTKI